MVVLKEILNRTEEKYGATDVKRYPHPISRARALRELIEGNICVFSTATRPEWEEKLIPVRIPIRKGILGYKLLLINATQQDLFSRVNTANELMKLRVGGGAQWSSTLALRSQGFNVIGSVEYEPLFAMLQAGRFDFFPRGVNEIFQEYEGRKTQFPSMAIEQEIALYLPQPTYFFVSPRKLELAKRIEEGLMLLREDGTLSKLFFDFHGDAIKRANLANRRIIPIENINLSPETPLNQKDLWYQPSK
ncbi:hypothetical protein [Terasakiella sp. A23]|uniref:hypothetical protein n=1 Tax=Terasakiella sp. FCG-A23 TaxID=3080561 RepID=UPI002954DF35|nr:hypothetical protein [Terasakiella sp. A23]